MDMFSVDARGTQRGLDFLAVCAGVLAHYIEDYGIQKLIVDCREVTGEHPKGYANYISTFCSLAGETFTMSLRLDGNTVHYNSAVLLPGLRDAMRRAAVL
ncbi:MAG: hypothetical protein HDQ88_07015 [Clostridia bacterium]|nr:hypothetical protein [Clostridia bacterium]